MTSHLISYWNTWNEVRQLKPRRMRLISSEDWRRSRFLKLISALVEKTLPSRWIFFRSTCFEELNAWLTGWLTQMRYYTQCCLGICFLFLFYKKTHFKGHSLLFSDNGSTHPLKCKTNRRGFTWSALPETCSASLCCQRPEYRLLRLTSTNNVPAGFCQGDGMCCSLLKSHADSLSMRPAIWLLSPHQNGRFLPWMDMLKETGYC